jgi:hypothetical protein
LTLLAFQNFLYEQGQYEYAKRVFAQSVAAGNDGRQMRLRMARTVLALYRIKLDEDEHHQSLAETRASQGYQHMGPEEARTTLRRAMEDLALVLEYPQTLHQPATLFELATVYYRVNDHQQCCTLLAHHFQMFPASPLTPFVCYLSAHVLMYARNWKRAAEYYQQLTLEPVPLTMASQEAPPGDDNNDAVPLIEPPPHSWGVMMECGRCHERIAMAADAALRGNGATDGGTGEAEDWTAEGEGGTGRVVLSRRRARQRRQLSIAGGPGSGRGGGGGQGR